MEAVRALGNIDPNISGKYLSKALQDNGVRVRIQVVQELREAYRRQSGQLSTLGANHKFHSNRVVKENTVCLGRANGFLL